VSVGGGPELTALSALAGSAETAEGTGVAGDVLSALLLELLLEVLKEVGIKVLTLWPESVSLQIDNDWRFLTPR
jgi:hypothetical protein